MELHNYMEDLVLEILENLLSEKKDVCNCKKCRSDVTAIALNKLPPKYVVTEKGRVYAKLAQLQLQLRIDIVKELTKAIELVKSKPKH